MGRCSDARDRLLDTASRLFHERGYTAVSVSDICTDAGLKKGSFYHFFPSKRDLVLAVIDRYAERYETLMRCTGPCSAREQLRRIFGVMHEGLARSKREAGGCVRGCPVGNLALEMSDRDERVRGKLQSIFEAWTAAMERILAEGAARGELSVRDPHAMAEVLLAHLQGAVMLAKASRDPGIFDRIAARALTLLEQEETPGRDAVSTP